RASMLALFIALAAFASEPTLTGKVVKIADGDTIRVLDASRRQHKIRLLGIDAPEKAQAYGEKSRVTLAALIAGTGVKVDLFVQDRYGRDLGKVWLGDMDVNLEMVKRGMAWHYAYFEKQQPPPDRKTYAAAEADAAMAHLGLWKDDTVQAP